MTVYALFRFTCDRCKAVEDVRHVEDQAEPHLHPPPGWAQGCDVEPPTHHNDLCRKCMAELKAYPNG